MPVRTCSSRTGASHLALLFATSGHSGVDRVVANLLTEFGQTDHRFDLLTIRGHGPYLEQVPDNVRRVTLRASHRDTVLLPLMRYLRRGRPHALLTANHRLNRCALIARRLAGVDLHVTLRMGMSPQGMHGGAGGRRVQRTLRSMRRWYPGSETLITPSEGVGDALVELGCIRPEQLRVIPNPLVSETLYSRAQQPISHRWFEPGAPPVVLGVGTLTRRKDFGTLIRAFARLRQRRIARLVILGEGPERMDLADLAAQLGVAHDCDLPGHVGNPYPYMAAASAFALTSRAEGSGAVLVEALACGTPATATDCPSGPAETLGGGRYGPLVPIGDDEALSQALERLLDEPTPRSLRQAAITPFTVAASAARYLAALGVGSNP